MIRATGWHGRTAHDIDPGDVRDAVGTDHQMVWVDLVDPSADELAEVQAWFGLSDLAVEDLRTPDERPKLEVYDQHTLLVAFTPDLTELGVVMGARWILTVHPSTGTGWGLDHVAGRFARTCPTVATPGYLLYALLDELVDGYLIRADGYEDMIEPIEERIFDETEVSTLRDEKAVQHDIFELRRQIVQFRRKVVPLRDVVSQAIRDELPGVGGELRNELQDVYDHLLRTVDVLDSQRELLGNAVDAHLAIISNNMNSVMKRMTSWGALLLGSTLIAGIYGMNFEHMPELGWQLGYPFALLLMAGVTMTGYLYFKRKGWI